MLKVKIGTNIENKGFQRNLYSKYLNQFIFSKWGFVIQFLIINWSYCNFLNQDVSHNIDSDNWYVSIYVNPQNFLDEADFLEISQLYNFAKFQSNLLKQIFLLYASHAYK